MKLNQTNLINFLEGLSAGGTVTGAARVSNIARATAIRWMAKSKEHAKCGDTTSPFYFEYPIGSENFAFLHEHELMVQQMIVGEILHNAMVAARDGTKVPALHNGQQVYQLNPDWDAKIPGIPDVDDETLHMLGWPTKWLRDKSFKKVPAYIYAPPPTDLRMSVLAGFVKRFAKRLDIQHNHAVAGQVLVSHGLDNMPRKDFCAVLPALEVIEDVVAEEDGPSLFDEREVVTEPEFAVVQAPASAPAPSPLRAELLKWGKMTPEERVEAAAARSIAVKKGAPSV